MTFDSIEQLLKGLKILQLSPEQQQFQEVLQVWPQVAGERVAAQTCPVSLERGVLSVATSSAPWSQELTFQARHILQKLNQQLSSPLGKIRFSPGQWQPSVPAPGPEVLSPHPSQVGEIRLPELSSSRPVDPQEAFAQWQQRVKVRSELWPLCPKCGVPAPAGELERWSVCALCLAKNPS